MNEQLQAAVAAMITKAVGAFEKGADFMSDQIPDVVHQLLMWNMVYYALLCVTGVVSLIALIYFNYRQVKWWMGDVQVSGYGGEKRIESRNIKYAPAQMLNIIQAFPIAAIFKFINIEWLKIWIAPKVWLIEYAANLVK